VFSGVTGFFRDSAKLGTGISTTRVVGERVTTGYFDVLGVQALWGRTFAPPDDLPGAEPVIVISNRLWRTKLDGNRRARRDGRRPVAVHLWRDLLSTVTRVIQR
jgi:hypothetical protein